jgi:hypothetical protein
MNFEEQADKSATELTQSEKQMAHQRTALRAAVIHEAIRAEGEGELARPVSALTWSGLAGGLSMGFSLVASGLLHAHLPDTDWRQLIVDLGYSVGFLAVILGRQQLYTENTLTVILPLLTRRDLHTLFHVIRLWTIVLVTNLVGGYVFALVMARTGIFTPNVAGAFHQIGMQAISGGWLTMFRTRNFRRMADCHDGVDAAGRGQFAPGNNRGDDLPGGARQFPARSRGIGRSALPGRDACAAVECVFP